MKKFGLLLLVVAFEYASGLAQKADLMVKSSGNGLYLEHKVLPKETYYSLGRLYNLHPKSIASFNKLDMNKGLNIDQKVKIPLLDTNFTQQGNSGTPVYYKVGDKEGLATVSKKNNNVLLASLRTWNNLSSDELKKDSKVIIGFLQSREMKSITLSTAPVSDLPEVKTAEKPVAEILPAEDMTRKEEKKIAEEEIKSEKKEEKKEEKKDPSPLVKEIRKPGIEGQGYFRSHFEQQVKVSPASKDETVTSGIFKTTSGWNDAKYYLLIDKVQPGVIVKVVNPANNKAIYAKVLGEMAGLRQNEGYTIRISNAAASALEITEQDKFIVKVNY